MVHQSLWKAVQVGPQRCTLNDDDDDAEAYCPAKSAAFSDSESAGDSFLYHHRDPRTQSCPLPRVHIEAFGAILDFLAKSACFSFVSLSVVLRFRIAVYLSYTRPSSGDVSMPGYCDATAYLVIRQTTEDHTQQRCRGAYYPSNFLLEDSPSLVHVITVRNPRDVISRRSHFFEKEYASRSDHAMLSVELPCHASSEA